MQSNLQLIVRYSWQVLLCCGMFYLFSKQEKKTATFGKRESFSPLCSDRLSLSLTLSLSHPFSLSLFLRHPHAAAWAFAWLARSACFWNRIHSAKTLTSHLNPLFVWLPLNIIQITPHVPDAPICYNNRMKALGGPRFAPVHPHFWKHAAYAPCAQLGKIRVPAAHVKYFDEREASGCLEFSVFLAELLVLLLPDDRSVPFVSPGALSPKSVLLWSCPGCAFLVNRGRPACTDTHTHTCTRHTSEVINGLFSDTFSICLCRRRLAGSPDTPALPGGSVLNQPDAATETHYFLNIAFFKFFFSTNHLLLLFSAEQQSLESHYFFMYAGLLIHWWGALDDMAQISFES